MENQQIIHRIPLKKDTSIFKLIIPVEVEKKIRHLCNKISKVEWSGTLFYICTGNYEDNSLEIKCVDIFPMDIGSATYTEFDMSPEVIAYMTEHPELLDCQVGLIHSHNCLASFFSGTDLNTLQEEGNDRNHFVSLIVNNEGTYTAAITRKLTIKKSVNAIYTYKTFKNEEKVETKTIEEEEEAIYYNYLDIIKEGEVAEPFLEIDKRLEDIKANKAKVNSTNTLHTVSYYDKMYPSRKSDYSFKDYKEYEDYKYKEEIDNQPTLFDDDYYIGDSKSSTVDNNTDISIPAETVKSIVLQLITGSIAIADTSRIEPDKWANQMTKVFSKRFNHDIKLFGAWVEQMAEFILTNFIPKEYSHCEDQYVAKLSEAVWMSLDKLPKNVYIKEIQDTLTLWMI